MGSRARGPAALVAVLAVCLAACPVAGALTAKAPGHRSGKAMKLRFTPKRGPAGTSFKGVASGFARGEPVAASEVGRGRRASRLPGGSADRTGRVRLVRHTFSASARGSRRLCLRGERSRRLACASYRVTAGPVGQQPEDTEAEGEDIGVLEDEDGEEGGLLKFVEDGEPFGLDEELDPLG